MSRASLIYRANPDEEGECQAPSSSTIQLPWTSPRCPDGAATSGAWSAGAQP